MTIEIKEEMLRCADCGHEISLNDFEKICFADCSSKDHYIGLIEDGKCPGCDDGQLEEVRDGV